MESATPAYNAACCYALLGKSDEAFAWIEDPRWLAAIRKCEDANVVFRKSLAEPELRDELLKRVVEDQRVAKAVPFGACQQGPHDLAREAPEPAVVAPSGPQASPRSVPPGRYRDSATEGLLR